MKVKYKGFEISAEREKALGGWENLYYYVMREEDGWFLIDNFTTGSDTIPEMINYLREMVDDYFENPQDYEDESW